MEKINLLEDLKKIRIFKDFENNEIQKILSSCHEKTLKPNEVLFSKDEESDAIYFLLLGQLQVISSNNTVLSLVPSGGIVGEIGAITNTPRSATVNATIPSNLLLIKQKDLNAIIDLDPVLGIKLYRNVVEILSGYLMENNFVLEFSKMIS